MSISNDLVHSSRVDVKRIMRRFQTLGEAEYFQDGLYDEYNHVALVSSPPMWTESGVYTWEVR